MRFLSALAGSLWTMTRLVLRNRRLLASITRVELAKRHAGSVLGMTWVVLQPALLLSVYLFVYMVVFKLRFPGYSKFDYVLYVFCGLVPYLGFMEALTSGGVSIKQNIHLIKNVMLPIELIPVRSVLVGMTSQFVSLGIVLVLSAVSGSLTYRVVFLPIAVLLEVLLLVGLTWILASLTVALPDITYFVNLFIFLLMFVSPIAFRTDMVPEQLRATLYLNPIFYLTQAFRATLLATEHASAAVWAVYTIVSVGIFVVGSAFFERFKGVLADYE
jgi:lipopolysaccharide transport system permease protein